MERPDKIAAAWKTAAERAAGIIPHTISGPVASPEDLQKLAQDLLCFARRVCDPVVEAYGEYAKLHSNQTIDTDAFRSVLETALEGVALYELEDAAEAIAREEAESDEDDRSMRFEMERA
jgi:hypothetical protein